MLQRSLVADDILAFGIPCLFSKMKGSERNAALGLFIVNSGIALLFGWTAVATAFRGVLLWPFIVLHAVIAGALLRQILTFENFTHSGNWDVPIQFLSRISGKVKNDP